MRAHTCVGDALALFKASVTSAYEGTTLSCLSACMCACIHVCILSASPVRLYACVLSHMHLVGLAVHIRMYHTSCMHLVSLEVSIYACIMHHVCTLSASQCPYTHASDMCMHLVGLAVVEVLGRGGEEALAVLETTLCLILYTVHVPSVCTCICNTRVLHVHVLE